MDLKYIFCIKWGSAYGAKDVNVLYGMVSRNITGPFEVVCFTDQTEGIRPEVTCHPLPPLACEIPPDVPGKWPKIALWSRDLFAMKGTALFIDLDSIIISNIDSYFTYGNQQDVITARNWLKWFKKSGQTSVFRFPIGGHSYLLENLQADSANISRKYQYEQNYVTGNIRGGIKYWPEPWTRHFRVHCMGSWFMRYLRPPVMPKNAKIITFPGLPKPSDAFHGRWSENDISRTPLEHLKWVFQNQKGMQNFKRHLKRYILPSPWVQEHWRE